MLAKRIIPCLDVTAGRVVKGVNFVNLRDAGDPVACAAAPTTTRAPTNSSSSTSPPPATAATPWPTWSPAPPARCSSRSPSAAASAASTTPASILMAGADKVSVNTAAVHRPELITELSTSSAPRPWCWPSTPSATPRAAGTSSPKAAAWMKASTPSSGPRRGEALGAGEILLTSMDTDGVQTGFDLR